MKCLTILFLKSVCITYEKFLKITLKPQLSFVNKAPNILLLDWHFALLDEFILLEELDESRPCSLEFKNSLKQSMVKLANYKFYYSFQKNIKIIQYVDFF